MNMIVKGEVRSKGVEDHQKGRRQVQFVLCQSQDRISG